MAKIKYMTPAEYAKSRRRRHLPGGSPGGVSKAIKAGRITLTKSGKINPDKADREWIENTTNDPARGMSQRQYADHRAALGLPGGSRISVAKALKTNRISLNKYGKIDAEQADKDWLANTKARAAPAVSPQPGGDRDVSSDPASPYSDYESIPIDSKSYAKARAVREEYRARVEKLKYEQLQGRLVDIEDIKAEFFKVLRPIRDSLLGIPDRVAPVVAGEDDIITIRDLLETEIRTALVSIRNILQ